MTRHLAKLLDAIWYVSMGLYLGLTGGLVLAVILTFRGARAIDAMPGLEPFSDPKFAKYHNDAVAGYIGQDLFMVGGTVALVLLGIACIAYCGRIILPKGLRDYKTFSTRWVQAGALIACVTLMLIAAFVTDSMNQLWPNLYDASATDVERNVDRAWFDALHKWSERIASMAWTCGLLALGLSPWCRRPADTPLQSGDGKEKSDQEEGG